ncbi:MAG: ATP-grasp domain-containing protein [Lachnospiraceae bacterium]|nr:ATP-grasp domain-containing protein [Lachnospiraceae bacterium]
MRNIIIVDPFSTGYNLVEDVIRRGYKPVVLETIQEKTEDLDALKKIYAAFYHEPQFIKECDSYEETLKLVKGFDPVLILAACETGVPLATRLADDMGLPGNSAKNLDYMIKKDAMHEALKQAGIRYIHGKKVKSAEEALDFCRENGFECAVVKPLRSAGSMGVFLCDNLKEVENAVTALLSVKDFFGKTQEEVLVQERIFGTEYIVNTLTLNGKHRLNTVLRYTKEKTDEGGYIYDYCEYITKLEAGHTKMVEYAFQVADAIHYQNGMIHGEYMIDDKGPVLIEVNCRPMGATQPAEFMDLITGQHETDSLLDTFLYPEEFERKKKEPYRLLRKGYMKLIMIPKDMEAENHPIWEVARQLKSTFKVSVQDPSAVVRYAKTRDLETSGGIIYMVHDDEKVVEADINMLRYIEKKYFQFILNDGMSRRWFIDGKTEKVDFKKIIEECHLRGAVLVAGDEKTEIEGAQCITPDSLGDAHKGFDYVIIGYQKALVKLGESECLKLIFDTMELVKDGGKVIIPRETYRYLSYEREGAEELMLIKGLTLEAPDGFDNGRVIGTYESI